MTARSRHGGVASAQLVSEALGLLEATLGLSLVLRIVAQAGGAIDVESTPDAGSVFTVYLPRTGDAPEQPSDARPGLPRGRTQRVMALDDEQA